MAATMNRFLLWCWLLIIITLCEAFPEQYSNPGAQNDILPVGGVTKPLSNIEKTVGSSSGCMACRFIFHLLQQFIANDASEEEVDILGKAVCFFLQIGKPEVCRGLVMLHEREITVIASKVVLNPDEVCGLLISDCGKPENPLRTWEIPPAPFPKPPLIKAQPPKSGAPVLRVLHLSDIHLDPYYKEGSNADCGEPLCCRPRSGTPESEDDKAGYWGDYRNCDIPLRTLENVLDHINKTHKLDYVIWTGDIPPHDIWNTTRDEAVYLFREVSHMLNKYLGGIPIYPAIGNHESSPVNSFPPPYITGNDSISWLYDEVVKAWSRWLPNNPPTVKLGAYYTAVVNPGFRIVSLNMNYCNSLNWWLIINSTDPTGELAWLVTQLQLAENRGEKVHIIGHMPPGEPDCLAVWSSNYYKIINRYENTVTAQFFGHTHQDEFEIFYDRTGPKPRASSIVYVGPSVTTYDGVNPGYRIYTVDGNYPGSSRVVLDHETYISNLTEANMNKKMTWKIEYSAKDAYNMKSLLPEDWDDLVDRFKDDDELFQKFYKYYRKNAEYNVPPCEEACRNDFFCRMRRGQSNDPLFCM